MKRRYNMPFGAECRGDGSVRFRLWAQTARQVEFSLAGANRSMRLPLDPCDQGWFELATDAARPGTQYHFRIDDGQEVSDPASRFQPRDVHGPSEVIDPGAFDWQDCDWHGHRWEEAVDRRTCTNCSLLNSFLPWPSPIVSVNQPWEKVMKNFAGLMRRLLEIQSGEKQRSPELIAEDERLIDGLRKRASTGRSLQTVNAGQDGSERGW